MATALAYSVVVPDLEPTVTLPVAPVPPTTMTPVPGPLPNTPALPKLAALVVVPSQPATAVIAPLFDWTLPRKLMLPFDSRVRSPPMLLAPTLVDSVL